MQGGYFAGGKCSGSITFLSKDRLLLSGKLFDVVITCGDDSDNTLSVEDLSPRLPHEFMASWIFQTDTLASHLPELYPNGQSIRQAFIRTLMANRITTGLLIAQPHRTTSRNSIVAYATCTISNYQKLVLKNLGNI